MRTAHQPAGPVMDDTDQHTAWTQEQRSLRANRQDAQEQEAHLRVTGEGIEHARLSEEHRIRRMTKRIDAIADRIRQATEDELKASVPVRPPGAAMMIAGAPDNNPGATVNPAARKKRERVVTDLADLDTAIRGAAADTTPVGGARYRPLTTGEHHARAVRRVTLATVRQGQPITRKELRAVFNASDRRMFDMAEVIADAIAGGGIICNEHGRYEPGQAAPSAETVFTTLHRTGNPEKLPFGPLEDRLGADWRALCSIAFDIGEAAVTNWRAKGMPRIRLDEFEDGFGFHPAEVWPDLIDAKLVTDVPSTDTGPAERMTPEFSPAPDGIKGSAMRMDVPR